MLDKRTRALKQLQQLRQLKEKAKDTDMKKIKSKELKTSKAKNNSKEKVTHMADNLFDNGSSPAIEGDGFMVDFGDTNNQLERFASYQQRTLNHRQELVTTIEEETKSKGL